MCVYVGKYCHCACSHNKATTNYRAFLTSVSGEQNSTQSWAMWGGKGPLSGAVTGVNPKLSHQHSHGSLSLKCSRKQMSCSLGENGKWTQEMGGEVGDEVERQAGCSRGGCLLWALISILGVWRSTEDDSTRNISFAFFLVNLFSKYVSAWLTQKIWQFAALALHFLSFSTVSPIAEW